MRGNSLSDNLYSDVWRLCQVSSPDDVQRDSALLLTHRVLRLRQLHTGPSELKSVKKRLGTMKTTLLLKIC